MSPTPLPGFTLAGMDGNAFFIMGRFSKAARRADVPKEVIDAVLVDARSGDYDHALQVFIPWDAGTEEEDDS